MKSAQLRTVLENRAEEMGLSASRKSRIVSPDLEGAAINGCVTQSNGEKIPLLTGKVEGRGARQTQKMTMAQAKKLAKELGLPSPVHMGYGIYGVTAVVTPALALNWLLHHSDSNRDLGRAHASYMTDDMNNGRFWLTHQGVAFCKDGKLQDGQHRLYALTEAEGAVIMTVFLNISNEQRRGLDSNKRRNAHDIAKLEGRDYMTALFVAAIRRMVAGFHRNLRGSSQVVFELTEEHAPSLKWLAKQFPENVSKITVAPVLAAILRAWHVERKQRARLAEFCEVLSTGLSHGKKDGAAVALRNLLIEGRLPRPRNGSRHHMAEAVVKYALTEAALESFLAQRNVSGTLKPATEELFPIAQYDNCEES